MEARASLIERAAEIYDFGAALRARGGETPPATPRADPVGEPVMPWMMPAAPAAPAPADDDRVVAEDLALDPLAREGAAPAVAEAPEAPEAPEASEAPVIPEAPATGRRHAVIDRDRLADLGFIVPGGSVTALAEEFRLVKRQLLIDLRERNLKRSVLICSARPDEGKTFCAINLALSLAAERDLNVLLVDADVAKPDVARRLGLTEDRPGLLDALADPALDVEAMVIDTDVERLSVLPAGTRSHHDTEMLASAHAATVIERLAAADPKRLILFDSPPALAASPASVLALHVGQVTMVVRADRTSESDLREAVSLLDACAHLHLMLNAVSYAPGGRRFGSYYEDSGEFEA